MTIIVQKFAVFAPLPVEPDVGRLASWVAYTRYVNESWPGFRGWFEGTGETRRQRMRDAIRRAREKEGLA